MYDDYPSNNQYAEFSQIIKELGPNLVATPDKSMDSDQGLILHLYENGDFIAGDQPVEIFVHETSGESVGFEREVNVFVFGEPARSASTGRLNRDVKSYSIIFGENGEALRTEYYKTVEVEEDGYWEPEGSDLERDQRIEFERRLSAQGEPPTDMERILWNIMANITEEADTVEEFGPDHYEEVLEVLRSIKT